MAAYLVIDITNIYDEATYSAYKSQVSAGLEAAGGRYVVRGGSIDILEGQWTPSRVVVVRFDSTESARRWWASEAYAPLKRLRQDSTRTNMVLVEGVPDENEVAP